ALLRHDVKESLHSLGRWRALGFAHRAPGNCWSLSPFTQVYFTHIYLTKTHPCDAPCRARRPKARKPNLYHSALAGVALGNHTWDRCHRQHFEPDVVSAAEQRDDLEIIALPRLYMGE